MGSFLFFALNPGCQNHRSMFSISAVNGGQPEGRCLLAVTPESFGFLNLCVLSIQEKLKLNMVKLSMYSLLGHLASIF